MRAGLKQILIRWVLVVLPTILIGWVTLRYLNFSYTNLQTSLNYQVLSFSAALFISYTLHFFRARWLVTTALLVLAYYLINQSIVKLPGEFDVFYATARFQLYSTVFFFGWAFGLMLALIRWSYIIVFGVLLVITLVAVADTVDVSLNYILAHLAPVVAYGLYMFFTSSLMATSIELTWSKAGKLTVRLAAFALVLLLAFLITDALLRGQVNAVEKELAARGAKNEKDGSKGGDGYDERNGLMEKKDDGYRLKDTMRVNSRMSSSDKLMFCSKLDNFFPDGEPAPIYYVYHYLTRYDSVRETFTRDINVPSLDEFDVDPTELPMYYSMADTSIFRKAKGDKMKKIVEAQVYLSENTWKHSVLGPANVFAIQTIPVEKDFQKTFMSGYKIYSYASELNNAYFVYNISASPQLEPLQEQRHDELRKIKNYNKVDREFYEYYTQLPRGGIYDSITNLAKSLVDADAKPVDKVLAVRDYFLQRNDYGKRVFRYSLQAGAVDDPNIPSSKMLYNFLFKTKTGYCTYYAGASLFMLRALGVPVRFTTGFATVNRSDKNKGWYWFYASQAHAWTQVYFPEYGWLDFDMTIGNEDQQNAPRPDGTPPLPPPDPWLVLNAKVESVDSLAKQVNVSFKELIFHNTTHQLKDAITRKTDATLCRILYGERDTTLQAVRPGDSIIVVSYKDEAKFIPSLRVDVPIEQQIKNFPVPIVADEIHIRAKEKPKQEDDSGIKKDNKQEKKLTWQEIAWLTAKVSGGIALLILLLPLLYLLYRLIRVSTASGLEQKANAVYEATLYRLHIAGFERGVETPLEYAQQQVDPALNINFENFMRMYLRLKYTNGQTRPDDAALINMLTSGLGSAIRKKNGFLTSIVQYFNIFRALRYFQKPASPENPNETNDSITLTI